MREFFARNGAFLIIVSILGPIVMWSLYKDRKEKEEEKKKQENNKNNKIEQNKPEEKK